MEISSILHVGRINYTTIYIYIYRERERERERERGREISTKWVECIKGKKESLVGVYILEVFLVLGAIFLERSN